MYRCTGVPVYCVPVYRCTGLAVYWCNGVPVYPCTRVCVYLCTGVLVYRLAGILMPWCTFVPARRPRLFKACSKLVQACSSLFKAAQGLFKAVQGVFIPVLPVHRCTGVPLWRCTGVTVIPVRIGVPVYHELLPLTIAINKPPMTKARRWNYEKLVAHRSVDFCEPLIIAK